MVARSKLEAPTPTMVRTNPRSRNARSLFMTGPMTWPCWAGVIDWYQSQNPPSPTGSRIEET
jgi:hypothetical protein